MLFNSFGFLLFWVILLAIHQMITSREWRKNLLLLSSLFFYASWKPSFTLLLILSATMDHLLVKKIVSDPSGRKKRWALLSLFINLGLLAFFKYAGFFMDSSVGFIPWPENWLIFMDNLILPLGISFYTFQTLSFTLDASKGRIKKAYPYRDVLMYICFFPQLVAGPIVRAEVFLPQCANANRRDLEGVSWGMQLFVFGLFCKVVIGDTLMAPVVEKFFEGPALDLLSSWTALFAYSIQIYADFMGYSTCAIGLAYALGYTLPENFNAPHTAVGFSDFWSRWHISLSHWLRDYLFFPMAMYLNRSWIRPLGTFGALIITMLLSGLWHGASWMMVMWGGVHGLLLALDQSIKSRAFFFWFYNNKWGQCTMATITFFTLSLSYTLFRSPDLETFTRVFGQLFNKSHDTTTVVIDQWEILWVWTTVLVSLVIQWICRDRPRREITEALPLWIRGTLNGFMIFLLLGCMIGNDTSFIYFQF